jgi:pathogenesis-related protein 1
MTWWGIVLMIVVAAAASSMAFLDMAQANGRNGSRLTSEEVGMLVTLHNIARTEAGVDPLVWSKNLAVYAQTWADHLASTGCRIEHRPRSGKWKQEHGENIFIGTAGYYGVGNAAKAWEREKSVYHGAVLNSSNWFPSGHYTQMIWKNTSRIGCAKAECRGNVIVVCNYDPPGNILGQKPY